MELYARTEIDDFNREPVLALSKYFVVAKYGWYSFAYLLGEEDTQPDETCRKAAAISKALLLLGVNQSDSLD